MSLAMAPRNLSLRIVAGATFLLALNGCVNLDDAAGLSKLSGEARISLPRVSNDVAGTCARQNTLFENTPQAERPPTAQAQDCKPYQEIADHLAKDENEEQRLQEGLHQQLHGIAPRYVSVARQHREKCFPVQSRRLLPVWWRKRFSRLGSEM